MVYFPVLFLRMGSSLLSTQIPFNWLRLCPSRSLAPTCESFYKVSGAWPCCLDSGRLWGSSQGLPASHLSGHHIPCVPGILP